MTWKKTISWTGCALIGALFTVPAIAQGERGKAELKVGSGTLTIDYGRPALRGRDMLGQQREGDVWRMGMNKSTTLTTPVDLTFGSTKIPKGSYSLWLKKVGADKYELIFNSQSGQWGTEYDASKDIAKVPLKKENTPTSVELFTLELKEGPKGGVLVATWGTTKLSADFQFK